MRSLMHEISLRSGLIIRNHNQSVSQKTMTPNCPMFQQSLKHVAVDYWCLSGSFSSVLQALNAVVI